MSWEERILATGDVETLFSEQRAAWPLLRQGIDGLGRARSRVFDVDGFELTAWHIPHRIGSTTARVDEKSIGTRPCFLCPDNLPAEERALAFGSRFVITCNPYPILDRHVSVVSREHRPQRVDADFRTMLDLSAGLPDHLVLYNGPECGASAPDHMHFQACRRQGVPVMDRPGDDGFPARHLVLADDDPGALEGRFRNLMALLAGVVPGIPEPMVNIVTVYANGRWIVLVFPRRRHRPGIYDSGEILWSPGALDLTGMIVLPRETDLDRITAEMIGDGFSEVCLSDESLRGLAGQLEFA